MQNDYAAQYIPFWQYITHNVRNGIPAYDMTTDLGANFIGSYTYYGLSNPFTLAGLIFSKESLLYAVTFINAAIWGLAAVSAGAYCRRYTLKDSSAFICSILYAFSGAQVFNVVFQFADSIAVFPLLLLSFDLLVKERKSFVFALTLALAGFTNFMFFYMDCIFIAIYFFVKLFSKEYKLDKKLFFKIAFEVILGVGLTSIVLLPALSTMLSTYKIGSTVFSTSPLVYEQPATIMRILQSLILPPDMCNIGSLFYDYSFRCNSVSAYIPMFSIIGVVCIMKTQKKQWYTILIYACIVIAAVPMLNGIFSGFNSVFYARWFYMPLLIMVMMTGKFIDEFECAEFKKTIHSICGIIAVVIIYLATLLLTDRFGGNLVHFCIGILLTLLCLAVLYIGRYSQMLSAVVKKNMTAFVCVASIIPLLLSNLVVVSTDGFNKVDYDLQRITNNGIDIKLDDDEFFRTTTWSASSSNAAINWGYPTICSYNSMTPESVTSFWNSIDVYKVANVVLYMNDYAVNSFLSVKYDLFFDRVIIDDKMQSAQPFYDSFGYTEKEQQGSYIIYENENYIPIGFTYDYYISMDDIDKIKASSLQDAMMSQADFLDEDEKPTPEEKAYLSMLRESKEVLQKEKLLLKGIWLDEQMISKHSDILSELPDELFEDTSDEAFVSDCINRNREASYYFEPTDTGFISKIKLSKENLVFYSVGYDEAFKAYVDGNEVEIEKVFDGLCAVRVSEGDHTVEFKYSVKGLSAGTIISTVCTVLFAAYIVFTVFLKNQKQKGADYLGNE